MPEVYFECRGIKLPPIENLDFAVLATIFEAMRRNESLHICGAVSSRLLRNLEEFQEAWVLWRPNYTKICIAADTEIPDSINAQRSGVFAFSGGVDATFALLQHVKKNDRRTIKPVVACLIQGFDIPLSESDAFKMAMRSARDTLERLEIPLATISTNWGDHLCGEWTNEFWAALAACLHQFVGIANFGVIGADEDYAHLSFPWGSNPATNPLLSGGNFELFTEGAGFTRTQRVAAIAEFPEVAKNLRVCWEGQRTGRNCGKCEKCIRTKLNFMASGYTPLCFDDGPPSALDMATINARGPVQRAYLQDIYSSAKRRDESGSWLNWLAVGIAHSYAMAIARRLKLVR